MYLTRSDHLLSVLLQSMPEIAFTGKEAVVNYHQSLPVHEVITVPDRSCTGRVSLDDNLIIEGDNLLALKALFPLYQGRIDFVYIDPPYNTGTTSWVFNDNAGSPDLAAWLETVIRRDDLSRHDKWLCMMTPRLQLLRDLLNPDGVFCISIDHHEQHHLTCLLNEIFGEENYREAILIPRGRKSVQAQFETIGGLSNSYEAVLVYSKNPARRFHKVYERLPRPRPGTWNNHWRGTERPSMRFPLFGITPERGQWRWGRERSMQAVRNYEKMVEDLDARDPTQARIDEWYAQKTGTLGRKLDLLRLSRTGAPEHYVPPSDRKLLGNLWTDVKPNGSRQVSRIFGHVPFNHPKSIDLIKRLMQFAGVGRDAIVLDSFAGSGSTAHAVLDLNADDDGKRRFLLIESLEYAHTITAERIRIVLRGLPHDRDERLQKGLRGSFTYCRLGDPLQQTHSM